MQMFIKCSDISNVTKLWELSAVWSERITEEFFAQGDAEKALGIEPLPFMNREESTSEKNTSMTDVLDNESCVCRSWSCRIFSVPISLSFLFPISVFFFAISLSFWRLTEFYVV